MFGSLGLISNLRIIDQKLGSSAKKEGSRFLQENGSRLGITSPSRYLFHRIELRFCSG
jgi:hypothetical protein